MTLTPSATLEHLRLAVELSGCDAEVVLRAQKGKIYAEVSHEGRWWV